MEREIILNNGIKMPRIGIGGWAQKAKDICNAIDVGYRMIDTAAQYGNEEDVGDAIKQSEVQRDEIFLTTKLWTEDIRNGTIIESFEKSLKRLKTDYIDLFLIHWPAKGFEKAWLDMEKLYNEGRIRAIGVSNFEAHHFDELKNMGATMTPVVNQIESHPYFLNQKIIDYGCNNSIVSEAWCPLGGPNSGEMQDKTINMLAEKYGKTQSQIILRWHLQRGIVVIPKSSNVGRMMENIDIYNFTLSDEDIEIINKLDRGMRLGAHPDEFDF